jgi:hypothetical protein
MGAMLEALEAAEDLHRRMHALSYQAGIGQKFRPLAPGVKVGLLPPGAHGSGGGWWHAFPAPLKK